MKSKYLRDINCEMPNLKDDYRMKQFKEELEEYGLASYDTWNLDITLAEFLYISFKMYDEYNCVDTNYHTFKIGDEEWDMQQCIDYIIEESKNYLINARDRFGECNYPDNFFEVLQKVIYSMWW